MNSFSEWRTVQISENGRVGGGEARQNQHLGIENGGYYRAHWRCYETWRDRGCITLSQVLYFSYQKCRPHLVKGISSFFVTTWMKLPSSLTKRDRLTLACSTKNCLCGMFEHFLVFCNMRFYLCNISGEERTPIFSFFCVCPC